MNHWVIGKSHTGYNPCPTCGSLPAGRKTVEVGDVLHGYCGGEFGRDAFECKTVEAVGPDWVVVRIHHEYGNGEVLTATGDGIRVDLARYLTVDPHTPCNCSDD